MLSITLKRSLTTLAVMTGLLAAAGPAGAAGMGHDGARAVGLKADSNEVAVEGFMDYTDDALTQSRASAPLTITLCHEGFEIQ